MFPAFASAEAGGLSTLFLTVRQWMHDRFLFFARSGFYDSFADGGAAIFRGYFFGLRSRAR